MKKLATILIGATIMGTSLIGCRENKNDMTAEEEIIQEMQSEGAEVKVKESEDGDSKIKMETEDKEVKIKKDEDGDTKIKVDTNN